MTVEEFIKELDIFDSEERCIEESEFSDDLASKTAYIKYEHDTLYVYWKTKYWDEDPNEHEKFFNEVKEVLRYWANKYNFTEKLNVTIYLEVDDCSEWDVDEDDASDAESFVLNG